MSELQESAVRSILVVRMSSKGLKPWNLNQSQSNALLAQMDHLRKLPKTHTSSKLNSRNILFYEKKNFFIAKF